MRRLARLPVTLTMSTLMLGIAIGSGTAWSRIDHATLSYVGLNARHVLQLHWERVFSSVLITHGGLVFWRSWLTLVAVLAWLEFRNGSRITALVFWVGHAATVLLLAAVLLPISGRFWPEAATVLTTVPDVGPSAGYFACLAYGIGLLERDLVRRPAAVLVGLGLAAILVVRTLSGGAFTAPDAWIADLAHVVAFALALVAASAYRVPVSIPPRRA